MKVPDNLVYSVFRDQDERLRERITRKTIEIATGKRIQNISDDPPATYEVLSLKKEISQLSQFSKNRLFADMNLTYVDYTLGSMSTKVKELYTKAVQAKKDINSPDSIKAIGALFDEALSFLVQRANEQVGDNYIFSGSALTKKPFSDTLVYQGSQEAFNVQIGKYEFSEVFSAGDKVFSSNVYELDTTFATPTTAFSGSGSIQITYGGTTVNADYGRGIWYLAGKVEDPNVALSTYGINGDLVLYDNANNEVARITNYGDLSLNDLVSQINTAFGGENISATLVTNPDGTYTIRLQDGDTPPNNTIQDTGGYILESNNPQNFAKILDGISPSDLSAFLHQKPNGQYTLRIIPEEVNTTLNISFTGTTLGNFTTPNVFQLINEVKDKLNNALKPDDSDIMALQRSYDKIVYERSRVGSVLSQVKNIEPVQENKMDVLNKQKSDTEEVDLSESIMDYTRYRTAYEALMRIVTQTRDMTILRYL